MPATTAMRAARVPARGQRPSPDSRRSGARRAALALVLACLAASPCGAGTASTGFSVTIILNGGAPVTAPPPPPITVVPAPAPQPGTPAPAPTPDSGGNAPGSGGSVPAINIPQPPAPAPGGGSSGPVTAQPSPAPAPVPVASGPGICTNASQNDPNNAQVRVVCSAGAFVTIAPATGTPLAAAQYDETRRTFGPGQGANQALTGLTTTFAGLSVGAGTVTSVRIFNLTDSGGPLEMLVSF